MDPVNTDLQQTTDESLDLTPSDLQSMFGLQDNDKEPPVESDKPIEPPVATDKVEPPTSEPSKTTEDGQENDDILPAPDEAIAGMLDGLLKEPETSEEASNKPKESEDPIASEEKRLSDIEASIKSNEQKLAKADPMILANGTRLPEYPTQDGRTIYQLNADELNSVMVQLQNDSQAVMADNIKKAYDAYHSNKQFIENQKTAHEEYKSQLHTAKEGLEWAKAETRWVKTLKAKGVTLEKSDLEAITGYLENKHEQQPEFKFKDKDSQILDALQGTGLAEKFRKALNPAVSGPKTPDAGVSHKSVKGTSKAAPNGVEFTESQIRGMSREEFDKNEKAIERAMAQGRYFNDLA